MDKNVKEMERVITFGESLLTVEERNVIDKKFGKKSLSYQWGISLYYQLTINH
jgi:hypothetical protein